MQAPFAADRATKRVDGVLAAASPVGTRTIASRGALNAARSARRDFARHFRRRRDVLRQELDRRRAAPAVAGAIDDGDGRHRARFVDEFSARVPPASPYWYWTSLTVRLASPLPRER